MGLLSTMVMASSIHPIGLRRRRAASNVPTKVTGTTPAAVTNASATGPPVPGRCVRLSSTTEAAPNPSVITPSATAATGAVRVRKVVFTRNAAFRRSPVISQP